MFFIIRKILVSILIKTIKINKYSSGGKKCHHNCSFFLVSEFQGKLVKRKIIRYKFQFCYLSQVI